MNILISNGIVYPVSPREEEDIFSLDDKAKKLAKNSNCTKIKRAVIITYPELEDSRNPLKIISSGINKPLTGREGYCKQCPVGKKNIKGNLVNRCQLSTLAEEDAIANLREVMDAIKSSKQTRESSKEIIEGSKIIYNFKYDSHKNFHDGLALSSAHSFPEYKILNELIKLNISMGAYRLFGLWCNMDFLKLMEYSSNPKNE